MIPTYQGNYTELLNILCGKYIILCATFYTIFFADAMPTDTSVTVGPIYATTEVSLDAKICKTLSQSFENSSLLCRPSTNKCDVPEYCSKNGSCPSNVHLADRTPCDFNDGICYHGHCYITNSPCGAFLTNTFSGEPLTSQSNGSNDIPSDTVVCNRMEVCVDGECLPISYIKGDSCPSTKDGGKCSGNGQCTNENKCVCTCGWFGSSCQFKTNQSNEVTHQPPTGQSSWCLPEERKSDATSILTTLVGSTKRPLSTGGNDQDADMASASLMANAIIGGSIALMFAVAVIFGATSIGFRKVKKKDRLRTMHQFRILSIFQPTKAQQRRLMKQDRPRYQKGYRERRNDISKNNDHRIILEPESNHGNHMKKTKPSSHKPHRSRPKKGASKMISETMV